MPKPASGAFADLARSVFLRAEYFQDGFHQVLKALRWSLIGNVLQTGIIIGLLVFIPGPKYFAHGPQGMLPVYPLDQANWNDADLTNWAVRCVLRAYSYDFQNYLTDFNEAKQCWIKSSWARFEKELVDTGTFDKVKQQYLTVHGVANRAPIIQERFKMNGRYTWVVEFGVLVTYQNSQNTITENHIVRATIQRVETTDMVDGIGIFSLSARPG